ncbi:hypothetical protein ACHQM5_008938 [Ranunculus cassubicifolius]
MKAIFHKSLCFLSTRVNPNPNLYRSFLPKSNTSIRINLASPPSVCFYSSTAATSEENSSAPLDYYSEFHNCRGAYKQVSRSVSAVVNTVNDMHSDLFVKGFCPVPNILEKSKVHMLELNYVYRELAENRYYYPRQYSNYENGLLDVRVKTVGVVAFLHWLETGKLISMEELDKKLGLRGQMISGDEGELRFARTLARQKGKPITGSETLESLGVKKESRPDGSTLFSCRPNSGEEIVENSGTQEGEDKEAEAEEKESDTKDGEEENSGEEDGDEGEERDDNDSNEGEDEDDKSLQYFRGFELDLEDYLIGICEMTEKMPEYVLHQVTLGDYECPKKVLKFLSDIQAMIRPLNPLVMYPNVDKTLRGMFGVAEQNLIKVEELCFDTEVLLRKKMGVTDDEKQAHEGS